MGRVTMLYYFTVTDAGLKRAKKWEGKSTQSKKPGPLGNKPSQSPPGKGSFSQRTFKEVCLHSSAWASHQELGMKDHCSTLNTHVKKEKSFIEAEKKEGRGDSQKGNILYKDNTINKNAREYWPLTAKRRNKSCFVSPRAESWFEMNESFR